MKPKTLDGYRSLLDSRILPTFGQIQLSSLTRQMIERWVRSMSDQGLSSSRIRQAHQCLSAILEKAADEGLIARNPARRVELPRIAQPDHRFLTAEQVAELAAAMPTHQHSTIVFMLAYGGFRWGELAALREKHLSRDRRRIIVSESVTEISGRLQFGAPKTHQRRTVYLPAFVAEMLDLHVRNSPLSSDSLVFASPTGGPLRYRNARRSFWDPARSIAGPDLADITPHDLRHTCASLMRAAGADVKAIQQQLGHRSPTVTLNTYTHLFESELTTVMERLDRPPPHVTLPRMTERRLPGRGIEGPGL